MRYDSLSDGQVLRRSSMGPVLLAGRRRYHLPVPGRGLVGHGARQTLRGFGAATGFGPPVGAGTGAGAEIGASQGASIGSAIVPGVGTAIGAVVGAIGGAIAGSINKKDPEQYNFDAAVALWQQNPNNIYAIGNKYLPIAGLFDLSLNNPHIPIYNRYNRQQGRGGEERFTDDLVNTIYQAAQSGRISSSDTPLTVMANVVQPWIDSWGYGPMQDPHADMIQKLIVGMIMDYTSGAAPQIWRARSGDLPASFASLPAFALPTPVAPVPTSTPTPSPQPVGGPETGTTPIAVAPPVTVSPPVVSTTPPAVGSAITAAMDAATGKMIGLPTGSTFGGLTPNGQWIVVYTSSANAGSYIVSNGALIPFTPISATTSGPTIPAGFIKTGTSALVFGTPQALYSDAVGNLYYLSGSQMILYQSAPPSGMLMPVVQSVPVSTSVTPPTALVTTAAPPASPTTAATTTTTSTTSSGAGGGGFFTMPDIAQSTSTPVALPTIGPTVSSPDYSSALLIGGVALGIYLLLGK